MRRFLFGLACLASAAGLFSCTVFAQGNSERRIALVIGNGAYQAGALNTAANDAGLIAQTLQAAGFDVVGARDLDQDSLRRAMRDFLDKAQEAGRDAVAFIYLAGYGLQLEGDNYFAPVDARIARDIDVAAEAVRISDYTRPLVALGLKQTIVVLDAARANPFARSGQPLAGGLALVEPEQGMLIAFNAAPGTVGQEGQGPYGAYAQALAEMMREGGLPLAEVFDRVRLRVNDVTQGGEVPWHAVRGDADFVFFERGPDAPPQASLEQTQAIRTRPIRDLGAQDAYIAALERDTLDGYLDFVAAYPDEPMAKRVRAIIAARREAITWRRTRMADTPEAYWSYLRRYPNGPHAWDARRRLAYLAAAMEPPPSFAMIEYDVPPPLEDEIVYIGRPAIAFYDPVYAFAPPPPPPVYYLPPPPPDFIALPPPPPPVSLFALPIPMYRPIPAYVRPPRYVAPPPPNNVIYNNIHNTVIINNRTNTVSITDRRGQTRTLRPSAPPPSPPSARRSGGAVTAAPAAPAIGPALPPSVARRASQGQIPARVPGAQPGALPGVQPGGPGSSRVPGTPGRPLPGAGGQPLPPAPGVAAPPSATAPQRGRPPASATLPGTLPPGSPARRAPPPGAVTAPGTAPSATTPPRRATLPAGPQRTAPGAQPPAAVTSPAAPPAAPDTRRRSGPPSSVQPGRTVPPPALDRRGPPPSAAVPAPARPVPPAMERRGPPPASAATPPAARPAPPSPAMRQAPPPPAVRAAPPPPAVRAAPPSPAVRAAPPPAAIRAAPPPAAARPAPPPPAARAAPPAGRPKCPVVNGKEVCPGR